MTVGITAAALADTAEQVRFFASCDLDTTVARYQNVVDSCICGVRFLGAEIMGDSCRIRVEVRTRVTLDTGKKIRNRYEKIRLELEDRQRRGNLHHKKSVCLRRQGGGKRSL